MADELNQLSPDLAEAIGQMTEQEKLETKAKILGFTRLPPTIDEFIESDLYIGKGTKNGKMVYPFWREFLREIYPDPLRSTNPIVILTGGIGIGKSTLSLIMAMYTLCKVMLMRDFSFFDLELLKGVNLVFFHVNVDKASNDFIFPFYERYYSQSMFFQRNKTQRFVTIPEGPRSNKGIGGDVIYYNLSEINFIPHGKAVEKINSAISRFFSRFRSASQYMGHVVLDSSVFGDASVVEQVIAESPYDIKVVRAPIWEVKKHTNQFSKEKFRVYTGDSIQQPFVLTEGSVTSELDPDKIIEVPLNLLPEYKSDIYKALQETAGVSTSLTGRYFTDISRLNDSFRIDQTVPEVLIVDFFDQDDQLMNYLRAEIDRLIPKDKILAVRFDVGLTSDLCGMAIAYLDEMRLINPEIKLFEPSVCVPIAIGISRKVGQETPLNKLKQFVVDLSMDYEIGCVTTDQFQSRQLQQDINREGIRSYLMSVDRTSRPYDIYKTLIYEGRLKQPKSKLLQTECTQLRIMGNKIDHLPAFSKDIADAVSGCVTSIIDNLDTFKQVSQVYQLKHAAELMKGYYNKPEEVYKLENKITNIYG